MFNRIIALLLSTSTLFAAVAENIPPALEKDFRTDANRKLSEMAKQFNKAAAIYKSKGPKAFMNEFPKTTNDERDYLVKELGSLPPIPVLEVKNSKLYFNFEDKNQNFSMDTLRIALGYYDFPGITLNYDYSKNVIWNLEKWRAITTKEQDASHRSILNWLLPMANAATAKKLSFKEKHPVLYPTLLWGGIGALVVGPLAFFAWNWYKGREIFTGAEKDHGGNSNIQPFVPGPQAERPAQGTPPAAATPALGPVPAPPTFTFPAVGVATEILRTYEGTAKDLINSHKPYFERIVKPPRTAEDVAKYQVIVKEMLEYLERPTSTDKTFLTYVLNSGFFINTPEFMTPEQKVRYDKLVEKAK